LQIAVNYQFLSPVLVLTIAGIVVLMADLYFWEGRNWPLAWLTIGSFVLAIAFGFGLVGKKGTTLSRMLIVDRLSLFFLFFIVIGSILVVLMSVDYFERHKTKAIGEYYTLIIFASLGAVMMAATADLVMIYIALELTSLSCYICAGYRKHDPKSNEAILKYFLLGLLASATMLYGFSFIYGFTGHTQLADIANALVGPTSRIAVIAGIVFALAAFTFKAASVPFHQWVPDVYEGAPTPVTAYLSVIPKIATFAVLIRILFIGFPLFVAYWRSLFVILSILSMFVGNLLAIPQTNIKRMLGYSSIAHAGYIIMGYAVATNRAVTAILIYVAVYVFMNLGAFAVVVAMSSIAEGDNISDYDGLAKRSPFMAASMAVFMLALAGLPPTAGLWGKVYVFLAAVEKDLWWLALIGLLNAVISLYYYFNVVRHMYIFKSPSERELNVPLSFKSVVWVTVIATLVLGVFPQPLIWLSQVSAKGF
jgi:proton-translocating NADH-quinone oxidoreductase chain N